MTNNKNCTTVQDGIFSRRSNRNTRLSNELYQLKFQHYYVPFSFITEFKITELINKSYLLLANGEILWLYMWTKTIFFLKPTNNICFSNISD